MACVIRIIQTSIGIPTIYDGQYILDFNPNQFKPRGLLTTTSDIMKAKQFKDHADAFIYWKQTHGMRPDGKPNRPLTAWTIEILSW